jgi:hypothetical protein
MAYVPIQLLKCVVFLGYINKEGSDKFAGSAFWISRPAGKDTRTDCRLAYLVTAAHVLDDIERLKSSTDNRVRIRVNLKEGKQEWRDTALRFWRYHPDYPRVDLAVLEIELDTAMDHVAWPIEYLIKGDRLDEDSDRKIELGDELFLAGLFWPHKGENKNIPIVRIGNIAALMEEPVMNKKGHLMDAFLVESRSIAGLSGSPVFIDIMTAKRTLQPTSGFMAAAHEGGSIDRYRLFGIMHGHFDWEDTEPDSAMANGKQKLGVNMGIAMVTPAEKILRVLDLFKNEEGDRARTVSQKRPLTITVGDATPRANVTFETTAPSHDFPASTAGLPVTDLQKDRQKKE